MRDGNEIPFIPAGVSVVDADGVRVGTVRAVYPHYLAVGEHGEHPQAYRVPLRAIADFDGGRVRLSVPKDVLDPMTAQEQAAFGLPEHGGEIHVAPPLREAEVEADESVGVRGPTLDEDERP